MDWKLVAPGERRNKYYVVRGSHLGEDFEKSLKTMDRATATAEAQLWTADWLRRFLADKSAQQQEAAAPVTFGKASDAYLAQGGSLIESEFLPKITATVLDDGTKFGDKPVKEVVHADLIAVANKLGASRKVNGKMSKGWANGTKNRQVITPVATVLHYANSNQWCPYWPVKRLPDSRKSNRQPADPADVAKLIAAATNGRQQTYLAVLHETGLRMGTPLAWRRDPQLKHLKAGYILTPNGARSRRTGRAGKNDENLKLQISPTLAAMLAALPVRLDGYVFPWRDRHNVYRWLKKLCRRTGVKFTPHQARHALATDLQERQIPDKTAAEYGAWRDPRSLQRYQHAAPKRLVDRSIDALVPEFGKKFGEIAQPVEKKRA